MNIKEILEKEDIRSFEKDIWIMPAAELIEHFSAVSSGQPKATLMGSAHETEKIVR